MYAAIWEELIAGTQLLVVSLLSGNKLDGGPKNSLRSTAQAHEGFARIPMKEFLGEQS